jgi:hypothetical protein
MSHLKIVVSNQKIDDQINLVYPDASYEVFYFQNGSTTIWRTRQKYYPEQACEDRWLSDFGLGDYESDKRLSIKISLYKHFLNLPQEIKNQITQLNVSEAESERKRKSPSILELVRNTDSTKSLNWLQKLIKKIFKI